MDSVFSKPGTLYSGYVLPCSYVSASNAIKQIHRCILMREPSVFRDMFSMPRPPMIAQDGELDEDPILISDDPDKFKDLLWAFYAPYVPAIVEQLMVKNPNITSR